MTTYVNATSLTFVATPSDQLVSAFFSVRVVNPAPGGGISLSALLSVLPPTSTPVITSVTPSSAVAGTGNTTIALRGTGFDLTSRVQWNGTNVSTVFSILSGGILQLSATIPAADLVAVGTGAVTVNTSDATPSLSNTVTFNITNPPPPTITQLSPSAAAINSPATVSIYGTGFITSSTVAVNGATVPSTYASPTQITATIPASSLATPGNANVTVTTPAPGGGTTAPLPFTVYISIPNNDIVYNAVDGLLYASVPATAPGVPGNAVIGIDPLTGTISRQIQVGSNPNQLALSSDGTQLFVGLDGSSSVAQVNLTQGKVVNQFYLGGGPGVYNPTYIAKYLAAVPGSPNSVVVAASSGKETIYDSGVPRTAVASSVGSGPMSFGSSVSTLYVAGSQLESYSVGSTGITGGTQLSGYSSSYSVTGLQYDNGALYVSNGTVVNASTGLLAGTFYTSPTAVAAGPVVSDSTLGRAFIGTAGFSSNAISVFDEASFNLLGTIPVNGLGNAGYPTNFRKIVRWGQSGIAVSGVPSAFTTNNQIFIFQSPLVKDLSSSPADISISLTAPATATTGASASWVAQVSNWGTELRNRRYAKPRSGFVFDPGESGSQPGNLLHGHSDLLRSRKHRKRRECHCNRECHPDYVRCVRRKRLDHRDQL